MIEQRYSNFVLSKGRVFFYNTILRTLQVAAKYHEEDHGLVADKIIRVDRGL